VDPPTLSELLGRSVSRAAAGAALAEGFSRSFSVTLCHAGLDEHEIKLALAVETGRYNSRQWTSRR
jgi:lipoate-protein ligase A